MSSSAFLNSITVSSTPINAHHSFSVKLNAKNYLAWKAQFLPLLNYQNLTSYVDGSSTPPPKTIVSPTSSSEIPNPEFAIWFQKDQMLMSWLLSSLFEEVFPYIIGLTSSDDVWQALASAFGSISQNRQLQLHIELQEFKKNDLSVSVYLQRAKALTDELGAAGRTMTAAEFNAIIYRNRGSDFHSIITALNLCPEPDSFHELHGQLVAHEILLKGTQELPIVNTATRQSSSSAPLLPLPFTLLNTQPRSAFSRFLDPCQICGLGNHLANRCQKRYKRRQINTPQAHHFYIGSSNSTHSAPFHSNDSNLSWFSDTAANYHVTPDILNLSVAHDYSGTDKLHVGNGQSLPISHTESGNQTNSSSRTE